MKSFIVLALCVAVTVAAPAGNPDGAAQILRSESDVNPDGGYQVLYDTSNGISEQAQGVLKNAGSENEAIEVLGSYSYPGPDGVVYSVKYIANESGFQPQGDHLPKPF